MDYGDKRTLPLAITAREIAEDICREINSDAGEHSFLGVFLCAGDAPTDGELRGARERLEEFYRALVASADREWERSHSFLFIHDLQRRAAAALGLEKDDSSAPTFTTVTTTSGISAFSLSLSGNLTVSGSAAVTGTLTVGGAPVPSTTQDNQWTSSQRFKGPDPWRDITAYMPAGGCDQSAFTGAHTTGTIASGTNALAIAYDNSFKNGCGIFIAGAGPVSALATPAQGAAPNPNVIGAAGSTTVHYKVAAIDPNYGTSAASAAITITTAPATRTPLNYVGVYWTAVTGAVGYLVYSDAGGSYAPLGYSFDCFGFNETGFSGFWPVTPPSAVTNQR
jgi:hypothetical protein